MQVEEISLFEAIRQMRKLSSGDKSFSFIHSTWDFERMKSSGIRSVEHARLRPAARGDDLSNADHKLFYYDEDIKEPRNCWQILILFFNGQKISVN